MQNKANLLNIQMNVTSSITKHYENARLRGREENKANQTQPVVSLSKESASNFLFCLPHCPRTSLSGIHF